jgi:uridylate kinase
MTTRCGLFHEWMARRRIAVTDKPELMRVFGGVGNIARVVINVKKFLDMIETLFAQYIGKLKNPSNAALRAAFNAGWESRTKTPAHASQPKAARARWAKKKG